MNGRKTGESDQEKTKEKNECDQHLYSWLCTDEVNSNQWLYGTYIGHYRWMITYKNRVYIFFSHSFFWLVQNSNRVEEMWPCEFTHIYKEMKLCRWIWCSIGSRWNRIGFLWHLWNTKTAVTPTETNYLVFLLVMNWTINQQYTDIFIKRWTKKFQ